MTGTVVDSEDSDASASDSGSSGLSSWITDQVHSYYQDQYHTFGFIAPL